jgi:Domain of unknown function (DUF4124)
MEPGNMRKMPRFAKPVLLAAALLLPGALAAQTFKCTDKAGRVTYSSTRCSELGLKDAGEVPDRINVNPAYVPPRENREQRSSRAPAASKTPAEEKPAAAAPAPAEPERRCFTVQTPKGPVTRCNDKPES